MRSGRSLVSAAAILLFPLLGSAQSVGPEIPLVPGLTFVLAVHVPKPAQPNDIAVGDYEMVVRVTGVDDNGITLLTAIEAEDVRGNPLRLTIERRVSKDDLASSYEQILGFHTKDPPLIAGTTSLGPSLAIMRDLRTTGRAAYSVRNFTHLSLSSGTLSRVEPRHVSFPVLVNGRRTELPAVHVTGQLKYGTNVRPWDELLLDDPKHPITLRFAHGAVSAAIPFQPETTREVVRIDFPTKGEQALEDALTKECRVEVPGIYFDFNRATIKPESTRALTTVSELLKRHAEWRVSIEGHTDNIGTDAYNQDLSMRRAAAVTTALVSDFGIAADRLTSAGFGERRPVETNDTIAGRARNRRVELVRDCIGGPRK